MHCFQLMTLSQMGEFMVLFFKILEGWRWWVENQAKQRESSRFSGLVSLQQLFPLSLAFWLPVFTC